MVGEAGVFTDGLMLFVGEDVLVGPPEIGVGGSLPIVVGYGPPQLLTGRFTAATDDAGNDLPGGFTQGELDPTLIAFVTHKRPQFVEFELNLFGSGGFKERLPQRRQAQGFCLGHAVTVLRDTPNVLARPRRLERSSYARNISAFLSSL